MGCQLLATGFQQHINQIWSWLTWGGHLIFPTQFPICKMEIILHPFSPSWACLVCLNQKFFGAGILLTMGEILMLTFSST